MTPQQGSVLSQYYNSQRQGKRIPGYQGNVNDMRTTAPDGRSAYVDDYGDMYYMDTGERVETRAIPEDLSQPMVGPNSAYGPYYEFGPFGPYDTRDINDSRHPDNPKNRPQVAEEEPYQKVRPEVRPEQTLTNDEVRQQMQDSVALQELNEELYLKTGRTYTDIRQAQEAIKSLREAEVPIVETGRSQAALEEKRRTAEAEAELAAELDDYDRATGLPSEKEMMRLQREFELREANEAEANEARKREAEAELAADNYQDYPHRGGVGPTRENYDPSLDPDYDPNYNPYQHQAYGLGDLEDQIGYDPRPRPQVAPDEPYPQVAPDVPLFDPKPASYLGPGERPLPQLGTPPSAGYLRSTGEGGAGLNSYYDEINAYLANHSQDEVQQAMGTYGVSQEDVDAARAYQQPQYARGGLSRMLRKVNRKVR